MLETWSVACGTDVRMESCVNRTVEETVEQKVEDNEDNKAPLVHRIRVQLGLTQEELARVLGVTVGTVNRWENGHFHPSKLARAALTELADRHNLNIVR